MNKKNLRFLVSVCATIVLSSCAGGNAPAASTSQVSNSTSIPAVTTSLPSEESSDKTEIITQPSEPATSLTSEEAQSSLSSEGTTDLTSEGEDSTLSSEETTLVSASEEESSSDIVNSSSPDSSKSSDGQHVPDVDSRWPVNFAEYGAAFRNRLAKLIRSSGTKTIGYKANNNVLAVSDKAINGKAGIIPFYHPDDCSTTDWNKEHVWPSSRGAGESGPGSDPQMLRPTAKSCNSARGNKFFGIGSDVFDPAECSGDSDSFPLYEAARGEVARIIFYCATRYYDTCGSGGSSSGDAPLSLSNNPNDSAGKHTMGRLDYLVEWNNKYPVTAQEVRRNNYLHSQGFARNPFIDHPEYANWIWDKQGIRTSLPDTDTPIESTSIEPISYKHSYSPISSIADLSGKVGIAGRENSTSTYFGMTSEAKSSSLPWYISGVELVHEDGKFKTDSDDVAMFTFTKNNDNYFISVNGKYLYNYIDGTHYSIGYDAADKPSASKEWKVTVSSDGKATIVGATNTVYLEYYNSSFCGYKSNPKESLVLIH